MANQMQSVERHFRRGGYKIWSVEREQWPASLALAGIDPEQWPGLIPYGFAPLVKDISMSDPPPASAFFPDDPVPQPSFVRYAPLCAPIIEACLLGAPDDVVDTYAEYWVYLLSMIAVFEMADKEIQLDDLNAELLRDKDAVHTGFIERLMLRALDLDVAAVHPTPKDGWNTIEDLARSTGYEQRTIRSALIDDRRDRMRRPGRDKRWRNPQWIHQTETAAVLRRCGQTHWDGVRQELSNRLRDMRRVEAERAAIEIEKQERHDAWLRDARRQIGQQNYGDDTG